MSEVYNRILSFSGRRVGVFAGLTAIFFLCFLGYLSTEEIAFLVVPFGLLVFLWGLGDFRRLYLLIWATIPFAIEVDLPGGLSTDFPAEALMWLSCLLFGGYLFLYHKKLDFSFILHPVFILLVFHFFWIIFTSIISEEPLISFKYTLAKSWYLVCFVLIPLLLFRDIKDFKQWGLYFLVPLIGTVIIIMIRHSQYGFTFDTINKAVIPIYRNHVDYACCLGIVLPFAWWMRRWFVERMAKNFFTIALILCLGGIYFSFTRTAWVCVPLMIISFYAIKLRLMRAVVPITFGIAFLGVGWLAANNKYLEYSPDFAKAITHKRFDDLVSATYKMEDISTVERFYRWVAGYYMVKERPVAGYGPGSFYSLYQNYVDRHFTTYVSDNPEHSGMHNYYLMEAVDQGLIGLIIFLVLIIGVLLYGESLYHRMEKGPAKELLMAALVSFCCILFILTLNDMVETDKVGSFFFFCIAIVILTGIQKNQFMINTSEPVIQKQ
ncbi:MAG TPA: O-antigen ligase family protein [Saprospiraceae bacterium]|nr:O-antigen ligase family protein [Saprospiraceae bacterium]